jgi:hypothetical protein
MLSKEKRRVQWSIAVGAVVAGLVAGRYYLQASDATHRIRILVADCEKQPLDLPKGYHLDCEPGALVKQRDHYRSLSALEAKIVDTAGEADNYRAHGHRFALLAFLVFCLPLAWYLVLDRIRELSAAIAGRDGSP